MLNANGQFSLPCLSSLNDPPARNTGRLLLLTCSLMAARIDCRLMTANGSNSHKLKIGLRKSNWHKSAFLKVHNFFCNCWENLVKKLLKSKMPFWPISQATKVCHYHFCCLVIDRTFGSAELRPNFLTKSRHRSFRQKQEFGRTEILAIP